jgi:hypothetical protein
MYYDAGDERGVPTRPSIVRDPGALLDLPAVADFIDKI